ncbi:hypothetical protein NCS57_00107300 [Fusarium keratoplasticum]|uniref:Uncharacterized protein n=1 Tax=Fusarium keratoplasticum TaxID=1328300 RepID=A0ACC0RFQ3_9HYPO|nr:hypothetical protein NCS57_00107300 [Fusarium keratoplasticum]KAI8684412.1 hypothetical protein NCS57_00107300 [Fusarium keratoplasticum]KAI8688525.1 hypothetical protein NCS55_00106400 [Fusarium keratoplasticum]
MAAQAMHAHGRDVRHGKSGSGSSLNYGPVPGSPTLTNPDMILPDYDCDESLDDRSQSPILMWNNGRTNDMRYHLPPSQNPFVAGPMSMPPSTPIIYGNGTMLSDIGEVTEVESVVGRGQRRPSSHLSDDDPTMTMPPSSTMGVSRIKTRSQILSRERRSSLESNSTVTSQGHGAPFADFDDSVSVDDINFQGDDEESMASSYVEGTPAQEPRTARVPRTQAVGEERYSTSSLSDRAEQILANAKQRLTTMEGNLSRARSSLYYSPMSDGSTPSPPIVRPATSLQDSTDPLGMGHSRMQSDISLQDDFGGPGYPQRSASALGAAGGYRQPLTSSRSADALGGYGGSTHKTPLYALDTTLEALSEDEDGFNGNRHRDSVQSFNMQSPTFGSFADKDITRSASVAQVRDLKDQMKDLRGKISSLKEQARADSLKRRSLQSLRTPSPFTHARWDQGFLEPRRVKGAGPETVPWQAPWNTDPTNNDADAKDTPDQEVEEVNKPEEKAPSAKYEDTPEANPEEAQVEERTTPVPDPEPAVKDEPQSNGVDEVDNKGENWEGNLGEVRAEGDEEVQADLQYSPQDNVPDNAPDSVPDNVEDDVEGGLQDYPRGEQEDEEGEFVDYESESGESLYHDTLQHPVSHEDREDAFDYEHFFLHSAMGTISQQRLGRRGSWGSVSSEDSVETTRGPLPELDRRTSIDTISSFDTFATATEGRASRTSTIDDTTETILETPEDSDGPPTSKRTTFGGFQFPHNSTHSSRNNSVDFHQPHGRRNTVVHRPTNSVVASSNHRPSVSSFESTGTNRSFPLVNKSKATTGVLTPTDSTPGGSPDPELKQISETLMNGATNLGGTGSGQSSGRSSAVQGLAKEDGILVERLVASLGKCVLGLTEASRASSEARMYRRRIDAARRILEGLEDC